MKIGIVTWFSYENYGTVLQAYALQRFLRDKGYDCEILNYLPKPFIAKKTNAQNIKAKIIEKKDNLLFKYVRFINNQQLENRSIYFKKFIVDNCIFTEELKDETGFAELNKRIDTYICGSDQVWTPKALDGIYYLNFVNDQNKKISYAPSFGVTKVQDQYKEIVGSWISRIEFLSIREKIGKEIIKDLTGKEAIEVLDPTLLLKPEDWKKILNKPDIQGPYILCYFVADKKQYWENVEKIRKTTGYKVVIIPITPSSYLKKGMILSETGPADFVGLMENAEIVLTDSFHGAVFAINYKKDFFVFKRFSDTDKRSENSRIYNILEKLRLKDRLIDDKESIIIEKLKILNYVNVEAILDEHRAKSMNFLNNALEN